MMGKKGRKGLWRRIAGIAFTAVLSTALLASCGHAPANIRSVSRGAADEAGGTKPVYTPAELPYLVRNPIRVETHVEEERKEAGENVRDLSYVSIAGLRDDGVEERINGEIKALYDRLVSDSKLPPYRGIRVLIPEGTQLTQMTVYVNVRGSFDNLLSLELCKECCYANGVFVKQSETLTFDLSTGEEITLADLFADDADWKELLGRKVEQSLLSGDAVPSGDSGALYHGSLQCLSGSFALRESQKFYVDERGIGLLFDYDTPEIAWNGTTSPRELWFSYGEFPETIAIGERFFTDKPSLYTDSEEGERILLSKSAEELWDGAEKRVEGMDVWISKNVLDGLPEKVSREVDRLSSDQELSLSLLRRKNPAFAGSANLPDRVMDVSVSAGRIGPFYQVTRFLSLYSGRDGSRSSFAEQESRCFTADGEPVELAQLFREDFDYRQAVRERIGQMEEAGEYPFSEEGGSAEISAEDFWDRYRGFSLWTESMWFYTEPVPMNGETVEPFQIEIPYRELGYENLNLLKGGEQ